MFTPLRREIEIPYIGAHATLPFAGVLNSLHCYFLNSVGVGHKGKEGCER